MVVKIDCAASQKAHSDVKHLLSACFALRVFYDRARKYWITYLTYFHHNYHGMKNCSGVVGNHLLKIGSVLDARVILIMRQCSGCDGGKEVTIVTLVYSCQHFFQGEYNC